MSMPEAICRCTSPHHSSKRVVLTGGPGAGKTAVLELARHALCAHVALLPEAAGILFGGGFIREESLIAKRAAQRAIFYVQRELENWATESKRAALVLCDRGSLDGLAYWPGAQSDFWHDLNTTHAQELARYDAVIHLRTPPLEHGYNHQNPLRIETAAEAAAIDERILQVWDGHPNRTVIDHEPLFVAKAMKVIAALRAELPSCCLSVAA